MAGLSRPATIRKHPALKKQCAPVSYRFMAWYPAVMIEFIAALAVLYFIKRRRKNRRYDQMFGETSRRMKSFIKR
jgi:hypothetical protein